MGLRVPFALVPFGFNSSIKLIIYMSKKNLRFSLATHSNQFLTGFLQRGFAKYLLNYPTSGQKLNLFAFKQLSKLF